MVAILSKFTVFCLSSYFDVYFLKSKLILFYNRIVYLILEYSVFCFCTWYGFFPYGCTSVGRPTSTHISSVQTLLVVWRIYQEWWIIGTDSERESWKFMLYKKRLFFLVKTKTFFSLNATILWKIFSFFFFFFPFHLDTPLYSMSLIKWDMPEPQHPSISPLHFSFLFLKISPLLIFLSHWNESTSV